MSDVLISPLGVRPPDGWQLRPIGDLCVKIGSGATPKGGAAVYTAKGTNFIRSQNVFDHYFSSTGLAHIDNHAAEKLGNVTVHDRDVLLNITGDGNTIARCCVAPTWILPARVNQHVMILRTSSDLIPEFLQRYLSQPAMRVHMLKHNSGGSRRALTKAQVSSFQVLVPPVKEQEAIAAALGALDNKIAINKRIAKVSRKLSQNHYFNAFRQDNLWESRPLGDVATIIMGQSPRGEDCNRSAEGPPLLNGPTEFGDYSPNPAQWTTVRTRVCEPGDLLICVRGSTTGRMNWADTKYVIGRGLAAIRAKSSPEETRLIYYALLDGMDDLLSRANGSVFPNLSRDTLNSFPIRWLVEDARHQLTNIVSSLEDGIHAREMESRVLAALRDTLLPQLMSGRLRVRDAEKIVEDHT